MAQKPMTKTQLVAALADEMGSDKKTAAAALDAVTAVVTKEVAGGGAVTLLGLAKYTAAHAPSVWCATQQRASRSKSLPTRL